LIVLLFTVFGAPSSPVRGHCCQWVDRIVLYGAVASLMLVLFYVLDATRLCRRFCKLIADPRVRWGKKLHKAARQRGLAAHPNEDLARHLLYMRMIAERSKLIGSYLYGPLVVLLLLALSRYPRFDNWPWHWPLVLVCLGHVALVTYGAVVLRRSARRIKQRALDDLARAAAAYQRDSDERWPVDQLIEEIKNIKEGALSSPATNPVLWALSIPFGGVATLAALEYLVVHFRM